MSPQQFAQHIVKTSHRKVNVKVGYTNGEPVYHVSAKERPSFSSTIRGEGDWALHPAHQDNRPTKRELEQAS